MSLVILFHFLCVFHYKGNVLLEPLKIDHRIQAEACFSLQHRHHSNLTTPNHQHTSNQEQYDQCGNSTAQSQAPDDGYINVRNMLNT